MTFFFKVTVYLKVTMGTQLYTYQWYVKQNVKKKCKRDHQPAVGACLGQKRRSSAEQSRSGSSAQQI